MGYVQRTDAQPKGIGEIMTDVKKECTGTACVSFMDYTMKLEPISTLSRNSNSLGKEGCRGTVRMSFKEDTNGIVMRMRVEMKAEESDTKIKGQ